MSILRALVNSVLFCIQGWQRVRMLLLRAAFGQHGQHFIFDPDGYYSYKNIQVGDDVTIGDRALFLAAESKIIIGNKVMFGPKVTIIGGNHNTSVVGQFMYDIKEKRPGDDMDVIFEDDIWVGSCATILKGVRVGRGSIVAAGALVNKDVPPYTIVGGIPARVIGVRFADLDTLCIHDTALYPPEKRLSEAKLLKILENARATRQS